MRLETYRFHPNLRYSITVISYNTVVINKEVDLSLEELRERVSQMLTGCGLLDAQQDGRVSPAPDARTIRYYATLGLVDRPRIVDREARYGRRHVAQLLAIKALQRSSLPLAEIQARLYGRSTEELEAIVASLPRTPAEVRTVLWREVTIEPGLKLQAEQGWSGPLDPESLLERIRAALAALGPIDGGTK